MIEQIPTASKLRDLQTWQEIGARQNSLMILIPSGLEGFARTLDAVRGVKLLKKDLTSK